VSAAAYGKNHIGRALLFGLCVVTPTLQRQGKNRVNKIDFLEFTVGDIQDVGEYKSNLLILYLLPKLFPAFFMQHWGLCAIKNLPYLLRQSLYIKWFLNKTIAAEGHYLFSPAINGVAAGKQHLDVRIFFF
jgi:hypothetical protein